MSKRTITAEEARNLPFARRAAPAAAAALGAGAGPAADPAAGEYETLFQVFLPRSAINANKELLRDYSYARYNRPLENCSNLSLVYLNIIENAKKYLDTCTGRLSGTTEYSETGEMIKKALANAGFVYRNEMVAQPVKGNNNFGEALWELGDSLGDGYATILHMEWNGGGGHSVVLERRKNVLLFTDPQMLTKEGGYPLIVTIPVDRKKQVEKPAEYDNTIKHFLVHKGPAVTEELLPLMKFNPTGLGAPLMNTSSGGRRRVSRKQTKSRKRKSTRKSR